MSTIISESEQLLHPLEPLTPEEIARAVALIRHYPEYHEQVRFVYVNRAEPVRGQDETARLVSAVLLDKAQNPATVIEAEVNLTTGSVSRYERVVGVQASVMFEEFLAVEGLVKGHPDFIAALKRRGITEADLPRVNVDPWSAGNYGAPEEDPHAHRILRTTVHYRMSDDVEENSYAHPIEGLHAIVDMGTMQVLRVDDFGAVPIPQQFGNYLPKDVEPLRSDLKPISITQPEGTSFRVEGHHVFWQNWDFWVDYAPREGLILREIYYTHKGERRPILHRAALAEMVVPYGDTNPSHAKQNAFDVGEYGVGWLGNSLELGCDCLGDIYYFDAHMTDNAGEVQTLKNVVCMHEEDDSILWKHTNYRTGHGETRRMRKLIVSFWATVGIYDYGFYWSFYQDGSIELETKLTGIMNIGAVEPGVQPRYGELVAPGLYAPNHQHFFCFRLDPMIDGEHNAVEELNTVSIPMGAENPLGNAFEVTRTRLRTEQEAQRDLEDRSSRSWRIINPSVINPITGYPVGFELMPTSKNVLPFAHPDSSYLKRAGFTRHHLWVTPYTPEERYPAGTYPNQNPGGDGLPRWTAANRPVDNTSIVVWYLVGVHHPARIEEWPVMPRAKYGFMLRPHGFFTANPALDVPPPPPSEHGDCCVTEQTHE